MADDRAGIQPKPTARPAVPSSHGDAVARSAFRVMTGSVLGLVAGLASQVITAALFGAGADMDAFLTALVIPVYLWTVLVGGLSFVVVPAFVKEEAGGSEKAAWALTGTFFWLTACLLLITAIAGSVFARQIIGVTAPGLDPAKMDLAAKMLSILMFTVPLTGLGSLAEGIQNARNRFFWPATARAVGALGNVLVLLALNRWVGPLSLAWGNLASAALAAFVPIIPMLRHGWDRPMPLTDTRLRGLLTLVVPFVLFGLLTNSPLVFQRYFASDLPDGDLSYIGYAGKISSILVAILATGVAAAIFPAMARAYAQRGQDGLVERAEYGFRITLAIALPAVMLSGAVTVPLVRTLFERGAFDQNDTLSVSRIVLIVMADDVVFRMITNVAARTFFVLKDTRTTPMVSAATLGVYIVLGKIMASRWGYVGLALASPLENGLTTLIIILLLARKLPSIRLGKLAREGLLFLAASLVSAASAWLVCRALAALPVAAQLAFALLAGGSLYMAIMFWRDWDTTHSILEMAGAHAITVKLGLWRAAWQKGASS